MLVELIARLNEVPEHTAQELIMSRQNSRTWCLNEVPEHTAQEYGPDAVLRCGGGRLNEVPEHTAQECSYCKTLQ